MSRRSTRTKRGERFAQVPLSALQSEAWCWLPHFARTVLVALTGQFSGYNNGALELTVEDAQSCGISKQELYAGIALLIAAGFIKRTVNARRRDGQGQPARYALTWRPLPDIPKYNIVATMHGSNEWEGFTPPFPAASTLREAMRAVGQRAPAGANRLRMVGTHPDSKRVGVTRHPENGSIGCHASSEEGVTRHLNTGSQGVTRHPRKNHIRKKNGAPKQ